MAMLTLRVFGRSIGVGLLIAAMLVFLVLTTGCSRKPAAVPTPQQFVAEGTELVIGQLYPVRLTLIERRQSDGKLVRTWYVGESRAPFATTPPVRPHLVNDIPVGYMRVVCVDGLRPNGNVAWDRLVIELNPARGLYPQKRVPLLKGYDD